MPNQRRNNNEELKEIVHSDRPVEMVWFPRSERTKEVLMFQSHTNVCLSSTRRRKCRRSSLQSPRRGEVVKGAPRCGLHPPIRPPIWSLQALVFKFVGIVTRSLQFPSSPLPRCRDYRRRSTVPPVPAQPTPYTADSFRSELVRAFPYCVL